MTIDERLEALTARHEALTMNVELISRDVESLRQSVTVLRAADLADGKRIDALLAAVEQDAENIRALENKAQRGSNI